MHQDRALGATYQLLADVGLYANQWSTSLLEEAREYTRDNNYSEKLGISVVAGLPPPFQIQTTSAYLPQIS